jgi:prophage regulatory protein
MTTFQSDGIRFMRLPEVIRLTARKRSTIFRDVKSGKFPRPVKIGPNAIAWEDSCVKNWMAARIAERDAQRPTH